MCDLQGPRHQLTGGHLQRPRAIGCETADNVALTDDAKQLPSAIDHQHGANTMFGQYAGDARDRQRRTDRRDLITLVLEDCGDCCHGPSSLGTAGEATIRSTRSAVSFGSALRTAPE